MPILIGPKLANSLGQDTQNDKSIFIYKTWTPNSYFFTYLLLLLQDLNIEKNDKNQQLVNVSKRNIWFWPTYANNKKNYWGKLIRDRLRETKIELERLRSEVEREKEREREKNIFKFFSENRGAFVKDFLPERFYWFETK